jgi:hypothetical protein
MSEQQIYVKIQDVQRAVDDANDRTLRVGENVERLRDLVHTDVNVRLVRVDERSSNMMWAVGILAAVVLGAWAQLLLMSGRLSGMERDVSYIAKGMDELRLKKTAEKPTDPDNIKEAKEVLTHAKTAKIKLPHEMIESTGKQFIQVSQTNPEAWQVAIAYLDYKSFLNVGTIPSLPATPLNKTPYDTYYAPPASAGPLFSIGRSVPPDVPQLRAINAPDPNQGKTVGPAFLLILGGEFLLDGTYAKKVIFKGVHIVYRGEQAGLDDVYFINCTFDVVLKPNGQSLASAVLSSVAGVNFKSS